MQTLTHMKKTSSGACLILFFCLSTINSLYANHRMESEESGSLTMFYSEAPSLGDCKTYSSDSLGFHHRICFDSVCILIKNYLETFNDDARNNGLGGYMDRSGFKTPHHSSENYMGWSFYNALYNSAFKKEFFLAYVYDSVPSPDSVSCTIIDEVYYHHSSSPFLYPDSPVTLEGISAFLSHMPKPEGPMNSLISGKDLDSACQKFSNYFEDAGTPTNENHCGFFLGTEIDDILNQRDCIGLRFFFGYEPERKSDKIRIILIGVDKDGENILLNGSGKEAIFYENEWPPSKD